MDVSNVNETHRYHSLPLRLPSNTSSNAQTRQKIVEILAGTANGCLSELGYFPGMPQKLKELEYQNEQWKLENMKLYQDNASLLELIHQQNERIGQIRALDPENNIKSMELDAELQQTRTQRDELAIAQLAKNNYPSQLQQNFVHLQGDYIRVLNAYRAMCAEVKHLQSQVRTLAAPKRSQPQGPQPQTQYHPQRQSQQPFQQQNRPQVQQHLQAQPLHQPQPVHVQHPQPNRPAQRQLAPTLLRPHVQKVGQQHHQLPVTQPRQQINTKSSPIFGQGQKQKYPLLQTQQAVFEQRHKSFVQSQQPRSLQSSGSMPVVPTLSGQDSFVNMANLQQSPPLFSSGPPSLSRPNLTPHSNGFRAAQSTSTMVPTMPESQATQPRNSFPNNSGPPTPLVPSHSPLNQQFLAPLSSNFNPDQFSMPPSNKVPSTSIDPLNPNTSTSAPLTISPQDTYLQPVNQVQSPRVKYVQSPNTNTTSAGTSISPVKVSVASQPVNIATGLPASIPSHQITYLKRDSPTRYEGHHDIIEQLQKRPRLERPQLELTTNIPIEPVADGTEDTMQMDIDEDEDIIEVGPDGLRLVKDCLSDLFGEKGEGEGRYCKLCIARLTMGYRVDPPKPFFNATNDELQEHCMAEHAEAWDSLRHSV